MRKLVEGQIASEGSDKDKEGLKLTESELDQEFIEEMKGADEEHLRSIRKMLTEAAENLTKNKEKRL